MVSATATVFLTSRRGRRRHHSTAFFTLGNPLLWWASTIAAIAACVIIVRVGPRQLWREVSGEGVHGETPASGETGALFWLSAAWAAPWVFWIPSLRDAYVYHYLPSYAFALALLAGCCRSPQYARHRVLILIAGRRRRRGDDLYDAPLSA